MPAFRYTAIDPAGAVTRGEMEAPDQAAVIARIQGQGNIPVRAEAAGGVRWLERRSCGEGADKLGAAAGDAVKRDGDTVGRGGVKRIEADDRQAQRCIFALFGQAERDNTWLQSDHEASGGGLQVRQADDADAAYFQQSGEGGRGGGDAIVQQHLVIGHQGEADGEQPQQQV